MSVAGVVDQHRRRVRPWRTILQVLIEEWLDDVTPNLQRRVRVPVQRSERGSLPIDLAVEPRPHDEEIPVVRLVLRLDRKIAVDRAPHVFLVPQSLQPDGRHRQRLRSHRFVERLRLPERVIRGMLGDFVPPRQLIESCDPRKIAGGSGAAKVFINVIRLTNDGLTVPSDGGLACKVVEVRLPESAVVEPIITHPAVDHRALRHGGFECRMGIDERHYDCKSFVRAAHHADAPVGLRYVLHEPVDRVVGVGRMIDGAVVQRPSQRPRHHVLAFRPVLAAHVLIHADVAIGHKQLIEQRQRRFHVRRSTAFGA